MSTSDTLTQRAMSDIAAVDWTQVRARYPAAQKGTYLNIASRGIISRAVRAAVDATLDGYLYGSETKTDRDELLNGTRKRFAALIGAQPKDIAITKNVTEGLNAVASAITWQPGDNVVFCYELEHPNNIYLWLALREQGVELRIVLPKDGAVDTEAFISRIDERTRLVTASSVTFTPGFRTDLAGIGRAARAAGALFLVDAVQSCGVIDIDVNREMIDALATSTSKGVLGFPGLGFLYVRQEWAQRLPPRAIGRFSVERNGLHQSEIEGMTFRLLPDARRFEAGNYNWLGIIAAATSLNELLSSGIPHIEAHTVSLATRLADGLQQLGLPVNTPTEPLERAHIVTVGALGDGNAYTTGDQRLNRLSTALKREGVSFSIRRGLLRFGFHCYNNTADVERVLDIAAAVGHG
jgi:selenocysteine lyase/cysteine desulfurase